MAAITWQDVSPKRTVNGEATKWILKDEALSVFVYRNFLGNNGWSPQWHLRCYQLGMVGDELGLDLDWAKVHAIDLVQQRLAGLLAGFYRLRARRSDLTDFPDLTALPPTAV